MTARRRGSGAADDLLCRPISSTTARDRSDPRRMNIHEYQAKAVLREVRRAGAARICRLFGRGGGQARDLARPVWCGEGADSCRGARKGGRREGRQVDDEACRRGWTPARLDPGHAPDRPAGKQVNRLYIEEAPPSIASSICRCWSIAGRRVSPSWFRRKAAWTSRKCATRRPEKILTFSVDPVTGVMPLQARLASRALGLTADLAKRGSGSSPSLYRASSTRT